ncbi:GMC family oxidoreductase [Yimella sp. cx-51]|uniref:GMC family oxidoreductase n=1 Tax=Yimella sp. cx-51 TaxID=2770551 RepID=UPI00165E9F28|nr:GMC family oxidoreductase [Yimella sp. cx-51]MBC9958243.1 GMC family oxidoreductase [Yimella sp. cx-51]MBD2758884.1 GMC family oxidoreductase [Yimella sp. cx-573]QTH38728.1 GMC family oxidoreductase [Yimella sp. cx-51]
MTEHDYDVVVVGSGFGGAVAALRLAQKGYRVHVYESGRRFEDDDFAKTSWNARRYLWAPALKCFGVQRIHKLPDVMILAGAGVGGGSLNYANTLYKPGAPFFQDPQWSGITDWDEELSPHYETAKRMLGVVEENPCEGPIEQLMRDVADDLGVAETFRKTPVGVYFGEAGQTVPDPYFGGEGPARTGCTECGNCMVGCRVGAKNTLMKNYIALAEQLGVVFEPLRTVTDLEELPGGGYRVATVRSGAWLKTDEKHVSADQVVLAAGTWGSQTLLHTLKAKGRLPRLSPQLGVLTRTNSEALGGAATATVPEGVDLSRGIAITTSFHVDETTHVENVRYGAGSNAMGVLTSLLVNGDKSAFGKAKDFFGQFAKEPLTAARIAASPRWSERTVIALVMQNLDNSITVSGRRRFGKVRLTSKQGHGVPNPKWIPQGHKAIRAMAERLGAVTKVRALPGGTWGEIFGIPLTAHFLGGVVISDSPDKGVVDPYHRVWGHPDLHVVDGSAISANLGVNPSLTITAQSERAMACWPAKGERDERSAQGEPYRRLDAPAARVPGVDLGMPGVRSA